MDLNWQSLLLTGGIGFFAIWAIRSFFNKNIQKQKNQLTQPAKKALTPEEEEEELIRKEEQALNKQIELQKNAERSKQQEEISRQKEEKQMEEEKVRQQEQKRIEQQKILQMHQQQLEEERKKELSKEQKVEETKQQTVEEKKEKEETKQQTNPPTPKQAFASSTQQICSNVSCAKPMQGKFCAFCGTRYSGQSTQSLHSSAPSFSTQLEQCHLCSKVVDSSEKISAANKVIHKKCFQCTKCSVSLSLGTYSTINGKFYCVQDAREVAQEMTKQTPSPPVQTHVQNFAANTKTFGRSSSFGGASKPLTKSQSLLAWCQNITEDYPNVEIRNFTSSFQNGMAFCAIIHSFRPDLIDFKSLDPSQATHNTTIAFEAAAKLGAPDLLDVEDTVEIQDSKSIQTYIFELRKTLLSVQ